MQYRLNLEFKERVFTGENFGPSYLAASSVLRFVQVPDDILLTLVVKIHTFAESYTIFCEGLMDMGGELLIHDKTIEKIVQLG
jgi:hypothetical protein